MHDIYLVLLKAFFWIEKRFRALTSKPLGKVGLLVVLVLLGTTLATHPVYAAEQDWIDKTILWFAELALGIASFLATLVIKLIDAMLPVMTYNNFTNSPIVNAGWAIVRDTVNMFFVIVLIAIAFGTIFGASKFKWATQVPRLLIFAIVINFSKTLCGLMIDFGQVIMLTFANALTQIAAGNFVQLLGFTDIYAIGTNNSTYSAVQDGSGNGPATWSWFFAGLGAVVLMLGILGVMLILFAILVYRVIMLWILIVIAPLAWFVGGVKDLISSNAYDDWWKRFKCLVVIGPVLTFFLWLTLAVAGAGNIALKSGFDVSAQGDLANPAGIINRIFEADRFLSLVIAIALLYAGFEAAQSMCTSMPGLKNLKGSAMGALKKAKGYGTVAAGYAAKPVIGTARLGLRGVGAGVKLAAPAVSNVLQKNRATALLTTQGRINTLGKLEGKLGEGTRLGAMVGGMREKQQAKLSSKQMETGKRFAGLSTDQQVKAIRALANKEKKSDREKEMLASYAVQSMGNKDVMGTLSKEGMDKKIWGQVGSNISAVGAGLGKEEQEKLAAFKKQNPHVTGDIDRLTLGDVRGLSESALGDEKVRAKLETMKYEYVDKDGNTQTLKHKVKKMVDGKEVEEEVDMNVADAIRANKLSSKTKNLFTANSVQGTDAQLARASDNELRMVSAAFIASNASDDILHRAVEQSVKSNNLGRTEELLSQLVQVMRDEKATPKARFDAQTRFDNVTGRLGSMPGLDLGQKSRLDTIVGTAEKNRIYEMGLNGKMNNGRFEDHGEIPIEEVKKNPAGFIQANFGNARKERVEDAKGQIQREVTQLTGRREKLAEGLPEANELDELIKQRKNGSLQANARVKEIEEKIKQVDALDAEIATVNSALDTLKQVVVRKPVDLRSGVKKLSDTVDNAGDRQIKRLTRKGREEYAEERMQKQLDDLDKS